MLVTRQNKGKSSFQNIFLIHNRQVKDRHEIRGISEVS